jgi:hypothetical protein
MNRIILSSLFIFPLFASVGCKDNNSIKKTISQSNYIGQLVPIDFNDSKYEQLSSYAIDTITKDGWTIKYLVKNDSTKYDDIYFKWSKGNLSGISKTESVLKYRRYFIPQYVGENKNNLFFWHGCARDCQAVLTLSKDSAFAKDFTRVIDYNIQNGQIGYVTDKGSKDDKPFQISIAHLSKNKEHLIEFKNLCMYASHKESCVDTIIFQKEKVVVKATLTIDN